MNDDNDENRNHTTTTIGREINESNSRNPISESSSQDETSPDYMTSHESHASNCICFWETEKFIEDLKQLDEQLKPARFYIIDNVIFDKGHGKRDGSQHDVAAWEKVAEKFKLDTHICENYTLNQIAELVRRVQAEDLKQYSAIAFAIHSHGGQNDIIEAKDGSYNLRTDIIFPVLKNKTLENKPKLFFIQACKGSIAADSTPISPHIPLPTHLFEFYATYEGFLSFRGEEFGTFFIQELTKCLLEKGENTDIAEIAQTVTNNVQTSEKYPTHKQTPMLRTTLGVKYCFGNYS